MPQGPDNEEEEEEEEEEEKEERRVRWNTFGLCPWF